jgi:superfamily II DNA or RNA helicase
MVWLPKKDADPNLIKHLRKELTIRPKKLGNYGGDDTPPAPIHCYAENAVEFGVPRAWWFSEAQGQYEYVWDVNFGSPIDLDTTLRHTGSYAEQQTCIDRFMDRFDQIRSPDYGSPDSEMGLGLGGIFQAGTGFGKTNTALGLIQKLGVTTLVLVHKEFLQRQWMHRIEKFLPNARVGIVREKRCEFAGYDIAVAMMQSLALTSDNPNRYPAELYDWPGFVVVDETHRVGAPTWSPVPTMFPAAYRIGLTATPRRKDGADKVFWWHIGEIIFKAVKVMPKPHVRIIVVETSRNDMPDIVRRNGISPSVVVNVLVKLRKRNQRVIQEIVGALKAPTGRKIMVLSERLDHLRRLEKSVTSIVDVTTSFYVGEWFTGEKTPVLKPKSWKMDEAGRKLAILTLYRSLSRRKWQASNGDPVAGGVIEEVKSKDEAGKRVITKLHKVLVLGRTVNAIRGLVDSESFPDDDPTLVTLQDLSDDEIFQLAREFKIAQKANEKKRPMTEEELYEAEGARVIFATYQMCSEGVDLPPVDTLVLASPISDAEQAIGRIRRECLPLAISETGKTPQECEHFCPWRAEGCKGKAEPIVADVVDLGVPMAVRRSGYRSDFYRESRFKVRTGA